MRFDKSILITILVVFAVVGLVTGLIGLGELNAYAPEPIRDGQEHIEIINQDDFRDPLQTVEGVIEAANTFMSCDNITILNYEFFPGRYNKILITYIAW